MIHDYGNLTDKETGQSNKDLEADLKQLTSSNPNYSK